MTSSQRTVVFWGAGATASLGLQTTVQQTTTLQRLASKKGEKALEERVEEALGDKAEEPWTSALIDLFAILGDGGKDVTSEEETSLFTVTPSHLRIMRRHSRKDASDDELRNRILGLRLLYDWPALKAVIDVCPGARDGHLQLNDLFNVLDMHGQTGHGFRNEDGTFLSPQRVLSARGALKMLQQTVLYIDWQYCRSKRGRDLRRHYDFAVALGRRMQKEGVRLAGSNAQFDDRNFYMGNVSFACFNWDPVAIWCQFVANRNLNQSPRAPHVGTPARKLRIFHDLGHFMPGARVESSGGRGAETPWHPMNESSALQLNDDDHGSRIRVRISKFLLPHGCLWWRECPNCGKLSSYMGDTWNFDSPTLIPPPPLKAFVRDVKYRHRHEEERTDWEKGRVDARACMHCKTLTYAQHAPMIMQSSFKGPPPPFLDEIKRDLRVAVQEAHHVVLMGYTLPQDDADYRAFLAARRRRSPGEPVKCSVVVGRDGQRQWLGPREWLAKLPKMTQGEAPRTTLEAARDLFGEENVRFYGGGIPNVFVESDHVTDSAVHKLLTWEER